jgi:hypothetical protein
MEQIVEDVHHGLVPVSGGDSRSAPVDMPRSCPVVAGDSLGAKLTVATVVGGQRGVTTITSGCQRGGRVIFTAALTALLLFLPVLLEVWAGAFGSSDTSRLAQIAWGMILGGGAVVLAWAILTKAPCPPLPNQVLASWAKHTWWIPVVSVGLATPIVFLLGAWRSGRRWLWLTAIASADLLFCCVIANGPDPLPPGLPTFVSDLGCVGLWLTPSPLIVGVWILANRRQRSQVSNGVIGKQDEPRARGGACIECESMPTMTVDSSGVARLVDSADSNPVATAVRSRPAQGGQSAESGPNRDADADGGVGVEGRDGSVGADGPLGDD